MIDTLNWRLSANQFDRDHILQILKTKCDPKPPHAYTDFKTIKVNHKNYLFTLSDSYLTAYGSLTKLHYGNNLQQLTFGQIQALLRYFEELFEMSLDEAENIRVDMACNIEVDSSITKYLDLFPTPQGYKSIIYEHETKYFNKSNQTLCFYDKVKEMKAELKKSPDGKQPKHILRYEVRVIKDIAASLNWSDAKFKNLYDYNDYMAVLNNFYRSYRDLPVYTQPLPSQYDFSSVKNWNKSTLIEGIRSSGGMEKLLNALNDKTIKREVRYLIKKQLETLPSGKAIGPELKKELDDKILAIIKYEAHQATYWA